MDDQTMTAPCGIPGFECVEKNRIHNCRECPEFPCDRLQPLADRAHKIPHNIKIFNLCLIKTMGLENWTKKKTGNIWGDNLTKKFD